MKKAWPLLLLLALGVGVFLFLGRRGAEGPAADRIPEEAITATPPPAPALAQGGVAPTRTLPKAGSMGGEEGSTEASTEETAKIEGVVLDDATGKPVEGAFVLARSGSTPCPSAPPVGLFSGGFVAKANGGITSAGPTARSGADGSFTLDSLYLLGGSPWDVSVRGVGYVVATACGATAGTPLTVRLKRGLSIEGVVVREDGTPISGAMISVRPPQGTPATPGHVEWASSGEDGKFTLTGLLPGAVVVTADHPKFMPLSLESMEPGRKDVRIVLVPALMVTIRITTEDGAVPDAPSASWKTSGVPAREGLQLLVQDPEFSGVRRSPSAGPDVPFDYLPLRVPCDRPDVGFTVKAVGCSPWMSERIELPREGGEKVLDVALRRDPTLGTLKISIEDRDRNPLSWVTERCKLAIGRRDGKLVDGGLILRYSEVVDLPAIPAGPWTFVVKSPGHAPARVDTEVPAGQPSELKVALGPPAKVRVKFRAPETLLVRFQVTFGKQVATVFPEVASPLPTGEEEGAEEQSLDVGTAGIVLSGLSAGRHMIEVISPELVAPPTSVDLVEGETKEIEISVTRR